MHRFALTLALLFAVAALGTSVSSRAPAWLDAEGSTAVREALAPVGEDVLAAVSFPFYRPWTLVTVAAVVAFVLWRRGPRAALFVVVAFGTAWLLIGPSKAVFGRARPGHVTAEEGNQSYPSGHVIQTAALAGAAAVVLARGRTTRTKFLAGTVVFLLIAAMSLSRIALHRHWPTDTLGGAFLGLAAVSAVWALARAAPPSSPASRPPSAPPASPPPASSA